MDVDELKKELARTQERGRHYPPELREAVLEYCEQAKREGKSQAKAAAELGVHAPTLCYWRAQARTPGALTPVAIVANATSTAELSLEFGPLRVRGLDIAGLAELLKRLI